MVTALATVAGSTNAGVCSASVLMRRTTRACGTAEGVGCVCGNDIPVVSAVATCATPPTTTSLFSALARRSSALRSKASGEENGDANCERVGDAGGNRWNKSAGFVVVLNKPKSVDVVAVCGSAIVSVGDAVRAGGNAIARAVGTTAGEPNGEPRFTSRSFGGGAMVGLAPPCCVSGSATPGEASMRTPCLSNAASLPPCCAGGESSSEDENEVLAGASSRLASGGVLKTTGAAGGCFGSARCGIGAEASPPPPPRSSASKSLARRDPPPSFLMPNVLFTRRPNLPIPAAKCDHDDVPTLERAQLDTHRRIRAPAERSWATHEVVQL